MAESSLTQQQKIALYAAWFIALAGLLGSLFFSEVLKYPPCLLCWYQRICLYPLVLIFAVGILRQDNKVYTYGLPLSVIGLGISIYHNLLYWKILPEAASPCSLQISCTTKFIEYFGFVTIPLMAMVAFLGLTISMVFLARRSE